MAEECEFNQNGFCYAWACYSNRECGAKDEKGTPRYVELPSLTEEGAKEERGAKKLSDEDDERVFLFMLSHITFLLEQEEARLGLVLQDITAEQGRNDAK